VPTVIDRKRDPDQRRVNRKAARRTLARRLEYLNEKLVERRAKGQPAGFLIEEIDAMRYALYVIDDDIEQVDESVLEGDLPEE
jgi:hypothetical protein